MPLEVKTGSLPASEKESSLHRLSGFKESRGSASSEWRTKRHCLFLRVEGDEEAAEEGEEEGVAAAQPLDVPVEEGAIDISAGVFAVRGEKGRRVFETRERGYFGECRRRCTYFSGTGGAGRTGGRRVKRCECGWVRSNTRPTTKHTHTHSCS